MIGCMLNAATTKTIAMAKSKILTGQFIASIASGSSALSLKDRNDSSSFGRFALMAWVSI